MDATNCNIELCEEDEKLYGSEVQALPMKEQQLFKLRLHRRRCRHTNAMIRWNSEITEEALGIVVYEEFERGYEVGEQTVIFVKKIWNSVAAFFEEKCISDHQNYTADFFVKRFLPSLKERMMFDVIGEALSFAVVQREFYVLLRFMTLIYQPCLYQNIGLIPILRFIYLMDSPKSLKYLMDEVVCDEFFLVLPYYLVSIYEELEITAPPDLLKYQSLVKTVEIDETSPGACASFSVLNAISMMKDDDEDIDTSGYANESFNDSLKDTKVAPLAESVISATRQTLRCVLETPEKLVEGCVATKAMINQTPIRTMTRTTNVKVGQLRDLLVPQAISRKRRKEDIITASQKKSNRMNLVSIFSSFV